MQGLLHVIVLGSVIGSNNLAASLALGALGQAKYRWRAVVVFGTFEFLMPLLGLWLGKTTSEKVGEVAQYAAPAILALLGVLAIISALRHQPRTEKWAEKLSSWRGLLLLELGLSLDNLVAGFALGVGSGKTSPLLIAGVIAAFSMSYTWAGMKIGAHGNRKWEKHAKWLTGLLLLALAVVSFMGWLEPS